MAEERSPTYELLERWHGGDQGALGEILSRDSEWIRARVHRLLGAKLRQHAATEDVMQEAIIRVLRYTPKFVVSSKAQFRALVARIVANTLCDLHRLWVAPIGAGMEPLPPESVVDLDSPRREAGPTPSAVNIQKENEALVRLALELLEPEDREALVLRDFEGLSFVEMAKKLQIAEDAARMRYNRALPRLADRVVKLRSGKLEEILGRDVED